MKNPRETKIQILIPALLALVLISVQLGCASSNSGTSDGVPDEIAAETLDLDAEAPAPADASNTPGPVDDSKLTEQIAKEELTDSGGFDLDATEALPPAPQAPEPLVAAPSADMAPVAEPASGQVTITNLKYVSRQGGGTVVIETSAPATYRTREVSSQNQVVVEIDNATLPAKLKRPFVTKDFNQSIASLNAYQEPGSASVRVVVQFNSPQVASVQQSGNVLTVAAGGAATPAGQDALAANEDFDENVSVPVASQGAAGDPRILPSAATDPTGFDNTKFYGRPISIEVTDTSVREVIKLIADQSGANIVLAGEVDGNITLKLRQVPWDQALLIVMKTRGLGYVRQDSILRVAPYENLQKEVTAAQKVAEAQKAAEPLRVKVIPVGYAKVDGLDRQITPFLTKERGRVVSDVRTNSLIVTDTAEVLARVSNLVKAIDTPPLQVLIEGKVVEAREVFSRQVGVNWGWDGNAVSVGNGQYFNNSFSSRPGDIANVTTAGAQAQFSFGTLDVFGELSAALRLYESEDMIKVISSPRVVVLNNEQANIVQGTNIPINVSTASAGGTVTSTAFQPIEMKLDVTPQVTSENDVLLKVDIKREFPDSTSSQPPPINRRQATTKVLVRNGHTAVIGGVYQNDSNESEQGIPWLRNLPVLGWLFKQKKIDNNKTELLVFITPRILNAETALQKENTL